MSKPSTTKTPLEQASLDLIAICKIIDETNGDIDTALLRTFGETKEIQAAAVDRHIMFEKVITHQINAAKEMRDAWAEKARILSNAQERHKERMVDLIEALPDIPFTGSQGKMTAQNSPIKLDVSMPEHSRTFKTITHEQAQEFDPRFIDEIRLLSLNRPAIKLALESGEKVPYCKLIQSKHLRIRQ